MASQLIPFSSEPAQNTVTIQYSAAATPYSALWYNNYGYYAGVQATYPSYMLQMAEYVPSVNKTFAVWGNGYDPAWAAALVYDHSSKQFVAGKSVFPYPDKDGHRNPTLLVGSNGHLYMLGGSKNTYLQVWKSNVAHDVTAWTQRYSIPHNSTYSQPHELSPGDVQVFFRDADLAWSYVKTADWFTTYSPKVQVVKPTGDDGVYALTWSEGNTVHMVWTVLDFSTQVRKNIWYAKSAGGVNWTQSDGTAYSLPIAARSGELAFDSGTDQVNLQDVKRDQSGSPVILVSHGAIGGAWYWKVLRPDGLGGWAASSIPANADRQFDNGSLQIVSANDFRAILPSAPGQIGQDGGNLEEWQSTDGGQTWALLKQLTFDVFNHNNVKTVKNGKSDFRAIMSYADASKPSTAFIKFLSGEKTYTARPGDPFTRNLTVNSLGGSAALNAPTGADISITSDGISIAPK